MRQQPVVGRPTEISIFVRLGGLAGRFVGVWDPEGEKDNAKTQMGAEFARCGDQRME